MKRRYLAIGMLAIALKGKPQAADTSFTKRDLPKAEIEILYSMYGQDGDHSAVTGGIGTERLTVYAPGFDLTINGPESTFSLNAGADIISSASTDRIDDVVSSASLVDMRSHVDLQYTHQVGNKGVELGLATGFSIESDYLSLPVRATFNYSAPNRMRQVHASFSAYFDDLRWGRLNPDYRRPVTLVYPAELRYKEWYDVHNRYSYNFKAGFMQVLSKRLRAALYPEVIVQKGLLATPFHRVYFTDGSLKVENLPDQRIRLPMGARLNYFAGSRTILKGGYEFYSDNFGIEAHSLDLESAFKISPLLTLSPFAKFYQQTSSRYFMPYSQHNPADEYYTSDYDLSAFRSLKIGVGFRWAPFRYMSARSIFDEVQIRYAYFKRSDNLKAHMISASFRFSRNGKNKPENN